MKKWTFLVAALLATASAGSVLTGCIDNDEPFGIQEIRKATANLLESKKALLDAQAAAANAEVEIAKINAEIAKAELEVNKIKAEAEAKVQEAKAEADRLKGAAEAAKTQAEAEKLLAEAAYYQAQADAYKAKAEAEVERYKAMTQDKIDQAAVALQTSKLEYEKLAYKFEQLKLKNAASRQDKLYAALEDAFAAYVWQLDVYNKANADYIEANQQYLASTVDLVWDEKTSTWSSPEYTRKNKLEERISKLQGKIEDANDAIAEYEDAANKLDGITPSELEALLEQYKADILKVTEDLAKANVEYEEMQLNDPLFVEKADLAKKLDAAQNERFTIDAYTFEPIAGLHVGGYTEPVNIVKESTYTFNNRNNQQLALSKLQIFRNDLINSTLGPNDQEWTKAELNELDRRLEGMKDDLKEAQDNWDMAVKIYNGGEKPNLDGLTAGVEEIEKAIAAYNETGKKTADLKKDYVDARDAAQTAYEKWQEESRKNNEETGYWAQWDKLQSAYEDALTAADEKYQATVNAPRNQYFEVVRDYQGKILQAQVVLTEAQEKLAAAEKLRDTFDETDKDYKTYEAQVAACLEAERKASKALDDLYTSRNADLKKITDTYAKIDAEALHAQEVAYAEAKRVRDAAQKALDYTSLYAPVQKAYEEWQDALTVQSEARQAYYESRTNLYEAFNGIQVALIAQADEIGLVQNYTEYYNLNGKLNDWSYSGFTAETIGEFPSTDYDTMQGLNYMNPDTKVYETAKNYVKDMSRILYGEWYNNHYMPLDSKVYGEQLVALDLTGMNNLIKQEYPYMRPFNYYNQYHNFGLFGQMEYYKNRIALAEAMLANADLLSQLTAGVDARIKALNDQVKAQQDKIQDIRDEQTKNADAIADATKEITDKIADLNSKQGILTTIKTTIEGAINTIIGANGATDKDGNNIATLEALKKAIKDLNDEVKKKQTEIENLEKYLEKAQYQLGLYDDFKLNEVDVLKLEAEVKKADLDREFAALNFFKARVDELQKAYDAATGETAE